MGDAPSTVTAYRLSTEWGTRQGARHRNGGGEQADNATDLGAGTQPPLDTSASYLTSLNYLSTYNNTPRNKSIINRNRI